MNKSWPTPDRAAKPATLLHGSQLLSHSAAGNGNGSPPEPGERAGVVAKYRRTLCRHLCAKLPADAAGQDPDVLRRQLEENLAALLREHGTLIDDGDQQAVIGMVLDEVFGFGPLSDLMRDSELSDILVNGPFQVFYEKKGQLASSEVTFDDVPHLMRVIERMVAQTGRRLDPASPMVDARLSDGSRINAILNPPAINGPLLSIRRFGSRPLTADDLIKNETLAPAMLDFLAACVRSRLNIVIAGGTGTGKTTLLNALSRFIRSTERIATIEDTAEVELQQPHVVKMEARAGGDGSSAITMRELVKNTLRIRPDRIIIGECRGAETLEMLQAMNTGHDGSMTTIHANSPREAFSRMELMICLEGGDIPVWALRKQMAASIDLVIHITRQLGGQRKVVSISEVTGMEEDIISMQDIFQYEQTGVEGDAAVGHFVATGIRPACFERLAANGAGLAPQFFARRRLSPDRE
jgi:pilus assembly protein CpaF